jgi:hypothetical protein
MTIFEGERLRSKITGTVLEVKKIKEKSVVLESEEGRNEEWTDMGFLPLFFEVARNKRNKMIGQPSRLGSAWWSCRRRK